MYRMGMLVAAFILDFPVSPLLPPAPERTNAIEESCEPMRKFVFAYRTFLSVWPNLDTNDILWTEWRSIFEARKDHFRGEKKDPRANANAHSISHTLTHPSDVYVWYIPALVLTRIVSRIITRFHLSKQSHNYNNAEYSFYHDEFDSKHNNGVRFIDLAGLPCPSVMPACSVAFFHS